MPLKDNGTPLPAVPAEFENVAVNVALAPGVKLRSVVPAGNVSAPSPPSEAFSNDSSPIATFPPFLNVTFTMYVPGPVVIEVGFVAAGPTVTVGLGANAPIGASITVI